ncbi:QSOX1, partial [Symbiodinium pilosum]
GLAANFPAAQKELKDLLSLVEAAAGYSKDLCVGDWLKAVEAVEAVLGTSPPEAPGRCTTDTCRVWTLFHFMSLAERHEVAGALSAEELVESITAFITHYFRCEHCRKHALEQLGAGAYGRDELIAKGADGIP